MTAYAEIEILLHNREDATYDIDLRFTQPDSDNEIPPARGSVEIDFDTLRKHDLEPQVYGEILSAAVFKDADVKKLFNDAKVAVECKVQYLRVRLLIGPKAAELNSLRWELMTDPMTKLPLATSERVVFSRFMHSQDYRPWKLPPKAELRVLVAVAAPANLFSKWKLPQIDVDGEIQRATEALGKLGSGQLEVLGDKQPVTLDNLVNRLRDGVDILYLACHGAKLPKIGPLLYLADEGDECKKPTTGEQLYERLKGLQHLPRLIVLASCESAGSAAESTSETKSDVASLAPRLADAGVPAILAMQGKITMETVKQAMPLFFSELVKDGQIDRAMAAARGKVRERYDSWMPALFLRIKGGRLWYEPGFGEGEKDFERWDAIVASIKEKRFTPVLGSGIAEHIYGDSRATARQLATKAKFALSPEQRDELPQVAQYYRVMQDVKTLRSKYKEVLREAIKKRHSNVIDKLDPGTSLGKRIGAVADHLWLDADAVEPHRVLARLPCSLYITTNHDDVLSRALKKERKEPRVLICNFREETAVSEPEMPKISRPLVFHMLGHLRNDESLVLTQDDYFDFLIGVSRVTHVPKKVDAATVKNSVLFLGFELNEWSFRVFFRRLKNLGGQDLLADNTHVMVQIEPDELGNLDATRARGYLTEYFSDQQLNKMSIYWGSARDFLLELHGRLRGEKLPSDEEDNEDDY